MADSARIVIIGGSSGIGEAIARRMLARGADVTIVARNSERLSAAAQRLGGNVRTAVLDATDHAAAQEFFAQRTGGLDHLVLSLSTGRAGGPFATLSMSDLATALTGKVVAYLSALQAALPSLRSDGSVTFIGAGSAEAALPATAGLAAVNGGLHAVVRPLAVELTPLRVNAVAPGVIDTPWWADMPDSVRAGVFADVAKAPVGRVGTPDDIAQVVALIIECTYLTGVVVPCDGGLRLR